MLEKVNRKQFHFLLVKFLAENCLTKEWFELSVDCKKRDKHNSPIYKEYGIDVENDDFSAHLYKCIDIYMGSKIDYYDKCIYGFFRYIPSGGTRFEWFGTWEKLSSKWEKKYRNVKYVKN